MICPRPKCNAQMRSMTALFDGVPVLLCICRSCHLLVQESHVEKLRKDFKDAEARLPQSVQEALNSGSGSYRP